MKGKTMPTKEELNQAIENYAELSRMFGDYGMCYGQARVKAQDAVTQLVDKLYEEIEKKEAENG